MEHCSCHSPSVVLYHGHSNPSGSSSCMSLCSHGVINPLDLTTSMTLTSTCLVPCRYQGNAQFSYWKVARNGWRWLQATSRELGSRAPAKQVPLGSRWRSQERWCMQTKICSCLYYSSLPVHGTDWISSLRQNLRLFVISKQLLDFLLWRQMEQVS